MNTRFVSNGAMQTIDQFKHFQFGNAQCSIPYFNNKTARNRIALPAFVGKGAPREIYDEVQAIALKNRMQMNSISDEYLKKILVDNNIGIDCSGFVYHILNRESIERHRGSLEKKISFVNCSGVLGKIRCRLRPRQNCDVSTFANTKNSHAILIKDVSPGDIITMTHNDGEKESDHILAIYKVDYQNFEPTTIYFVHAVSYREDGLYGSGIREGQISIINISGDIISQQWTEDNVSNDQNKIFTRAQKAKTEIRRLNWF